MHIDTTYIRAGETNAVLDYFCKSIEDNMLFEPHPTDPWLAQVENLSTYWMTARLVDLYNHIALILVGEGAQIHPLMTKADLAVGKSRCHELEEMARREPPGTLPLQVYLEMVECLMARYLPKTQIVTDAQRNAVRQYMAGLLRDKPGITMTDLPDSDAELRAHRLLPEDTARIQIAQANAARMVTDIDAATRSRMRKIVLDAERRRVTDGSSHYQPAPLAQALQDEFSDLHRDWRRIAVTETGNNAADGMLASRIGQKVQWLAHQGACVACRGYHGQVFTVVSSSKPDKNPYTEVWPGKGVMNVGRSISKMKRLDDRTMVERTKDELIVPMITLHPHCRCVFIPNVKDNLTAHQRQILDDMGMQD